MGKKKKSIQRLTAGELEILQMLWRTEGVTILEAQQALGLDIGYTTVQTRLERLVKKGIVAKEGGRPARYRAAVTSDEVQQTDLDMLVDRVSGGQVVPLVAHLVNRRELSPQDLRELKELIARAEKESRKKK